MIGDEFVLTVGRSWGFDFVARRFIGSIKGWVSYSFTNATRRTATEIFPPGHDRRHTINVVMQTGGPLGSDMSVRWGYGSPLPFTSFTGEWNHRRYSAINNTFIDANLEPIGSALNAERYPSYSRLDISLKWSSRKWGGTLRPYLNIVNAYNRRNVFLYFFDFDNSPVTRTGVSQLPFVPTFGLEFEW